MRTGPEVIVLRAVFGMFKFAVTSVLIFGPIYFFGMKVVPMIQGTLAETKAIQAKNDVKRQQRLDELAQLANENGDLTLAASAAAGAAHDANSASQAPIEKQPARTVVIDEAYDPSPEAEIDKMMIPDSAKQEILRNYRRTGFMPQIESAQNDRQPSSAD